MVSMSPSGKPVNLHSKYRILVLLCVCLLPPNIQGCLRGSVTNLTASAISKTLASPNYPSGYPKNVSCTWRITAPTGYLVKLEITATIGCTINDHLEIYDRERQKPEDLLRRICATVAVNLSSFGQAYVRFSSNSTYDPPLNRSFVINYSAVLPDSFCSLSNNLGEAQNIILQELNGGTITSPNFPNKFPPRLNCKWKFLAPPGHIVKLYIDTVNINITRCLSDLEFLHITDGVGLLAPRLRNITCQYKSIYRPARSFYVLSSGEKLQMHFFLNTSKVTGYGFKANYTFESLDTSGSCGEGRRGIINLRGQGAAFSSPGFGLVSEKHPKDMTCLWNITADPGFIIEINAISNRLTMSCDSEFVKVYDGATLDGRVLARMCYLQTVRYAYSTGNSVLVEMRTSSSDQRGDGFHMSYRAVKYDRTNYMCSSSYSEMVVDKGTARIVGPWYPEGYPNNAYCQWTYKVPFARLAKVTIAKLHLQDSKNCTSDRVEVLDEKSTYRLLCGNPTTPISVVAPGRLLTVRFRSDWKSGYSGFEAMFDSIEDASFGGCNVQGQDNYLPLNASNGIFSSPRFPNGFPGNMMCTWVITVAEGSYVHLVFERFHLHYNCKDSNVEIRDGPSLESKSLIKSTETEYCIFSNMLSIFSSGRQLSVRFTSRDDSIYFEGFNATYSSVTTLPLSISCRDHSLKTITSSSGQIASHNYPLNYSNHARCHWIITVPYEHLVKLTFESFDIQKTPGCTGDFVKVFDGRDIFSQSLGKFCGNQKPKPLYSSGTTIYITFDSDGTGRYPGFKASFKADLQLHKKTIGLIVAFSVIGGICLIAAIVGVVICKRDRPHGGTRGEILHLNAIPQVAES